MKLAESQEAVVYENEKKQDFDLGSDSDDEKDIDVAKVKMAYLDEKVAAICALGHFAVASPKTFGPYFDQTINMLDSKYSFKFSYNFFQEYVRVESVVCYKHITEALLRFTYDSIPKYNKGIISYKLILGLPVNTRMDQRIE